MKHKYNIGQLVELESGVRLVVAQQTIGMMGENQYSLSVNVSYPCTLSDCDESLLSPVHNPTYREPS